MTNSSQPISDFFGILSSPADRLTTATRKLPDDFDAAVGVDVGATTLSLGNVTALQSPGVADAAVQALAPVTEELTVGSVII